MEMARVGQSQKPALLQGGYAAQLRKQNLVNRPRLIGPGRIIR